MKSKKTLNHPIIEFNLALPSLDTDENGKYPSCRSRKAMLTKLCIFCCSEDKYIEESCILYEIN